MSNLNWTYFFKIYLKNFFFFFIVLGSDPERLRDKDLRKDPGRQRVRKRKGRSQSGLNVSKVKTKNHFSQQRFKVEGH